MTGKSQALGGTSHMENNLLSPIERVIGLLRKA
jgi:hypothetical protein